MAYESSDLAVARRHKDATTAEQIFSDLATALAWLRHATRMLPSMWGAFASGGHAAFLAAKLPEVAAAFDFYGAGLSRMRPGGGEPSSALLAAIKGQLMWVSGKADPLIPAEDRDDIGAALINPHRSGQLQRFVVCAGADHCLMC